MSHLPATAELDVARSFAVMVRQVKDYAIFLLDADGVIRTWNAAAAAMKGYDEDEAVGAYFGMLYTDEDQARGHPRHNLEKAAAKGTFQEETWRRKKDGSLFWALVEIIAIHSDQGVLTGFCKITRDLSARKALMQQLAAERERAQITLGAISDGVVSYRADGKIDFINAKAEELTSWRMGEAAGQELHRVVDLRQRDEGEQSPIPLPGADAGAPCAAVLVGRDGARREVEYARAAIRQENGSNAGGVMVIRDITHLRHIEKELKHADRRKDEFLAMLAHELRNPLAPISAAADLLAMGRLDPARLQRTSEVISRQVRHMTSLIDDLLDVSRVTRGQVVLHKEDLDLKSVVTDALEQVRPLIESRSHHLSVELGPGEATVHGDRKRLVQVIANVLTNAAKYTIAGGHIALRMDVRESEVVLCVQDDGIGMPPELVRRAFQMFTQGERSPDRAQGGLGIGLALVRSLVELHDGSVTAESPGVGRGSTFTIKLPRLRRSSPPWMGATHGDAAQPPTATPVRVLVVDDNVDAAHLLAEFLGAFGHEVAVEHRSLAALESAAGFAPDVCLLDIGLPDLDGLELARRLRASGSEAMLVAVTGYGQPRDVQQAIEAGFDAHFVKPVDKERLLGVLDQVGPRKRSVATPPATS